MMKQQPVKSLCAVAMETRLKWLIGRSSELGASHEGKSLCVCVCVCVCDSKIAKIIMLIII